MVSRWWSNGGVEYDFDLGIFNLERGANERERERELDNKTIVFN